MELETYKMESVDPDEITRILDEHEIRGIERIETIGMTYSELFAWLGY